MTKEELEKEAEEWLCNNLHSASEEDFIKAMVDIAEPREKRIAELEKEKCELLGIIQGKDKAIKELQDKLNNLSSVAEVRLANWQKYKKENEELKEKLAGAERTRANLRQIGFPTFQSCKEYADKLNYAKTIIKDLLNNSDEYAKQRAIDFLKEE